ncbi:hypothetical protein [Helicobacter marmotae]|uniref:hypothetical protein n=1 Tax=Helicobacter marmotae TaxID=152490 RepID=UPI000CF17200|nr:hypothetical protein [Helicobacter marmotae]
MKLQEIKETLLKDLAQRVEDKILEQGNYELLEKLILNDNINEKEAFAIAALGTTWKRTGFAFDKRLEKATDEVFYLKKDEGLSFESKIQNTSNADTQVDSNAGGGGVIKISIPKSRSLIA